MFLKLPKNGGISFLSSADYKKFGTTRFIFEILPYVLFAVLNGLTLLFDYGASPFGIPFALLLLYIYFFLEKKVLAVTLILFTNNTLGCLFLGSISVRYVIFIFFVAELFSIKKISFKGVALAGLSAVLAFVPLLTGDATLMEAFETFAFYIVFVLLYEHQNSDGFLDEYLNGILLAILPLLFEQVFFASTVSSGERLGIEGTIFSNPNLAAFYICFAMVALLYTNKLKLYFKIPIAIYLLVGISKTLSVAGFIGMFLVLVFGLSMKPKLRRTLIIASAVILVFVLLLNVYQSLPDEYHNISIDGYVERVTGMFNSALSGDVSDATSYRSVIFQGKLEYIFNESGFIHMMFGGSSVFSGNVQIKGYSLAPHNVYIDYLLLYGVVGTFILLSYAITRGFFGLKKYLAGEKEQKYILILKFLMLWCGVTTSMYSGIFGAVFFVSLFIL